MKIIYIIDGMYNSAGRERVVANKANYLSRMGHKITVLTTDQKGRPSYYPLAEDVEMIDLGINYDEYYGKGIIDKLVSHRQKSHLFRERLGTFLKAHPQDVVVALMDRYVPAIISLAEKNVTVYEHHFNKFAMYDLRESRTKHLLQQVVYKVKDWIYTRFYYRKLDIFAVLTEEDKEYWGKDFKNIVCMPNSISYDKTKKTSLDNKCVISVGRLTYQKGYDRLIKIWRNIEPLQPEWQLHIYGGGEDKEKLLSMIDDFHLKNVRIFEPTPNIGEKLLEASIYVMTSRFEGLPMVLLEAMAVGLPLISFDCKCGPRDIIDDGKNGFLIPDGDSRLMEQRICCLMNDEIIRKKQGLEAKEVASKYSHEVIMNEWIHLFNKNKQAKK